VIYLAFDRLARRLTRRDVRARAAGVPAAST